MLRGLALIAFIAACGRIDFAPVAAPTRFTVDSFSTSGDTYVPIPGAVLALPAVPGQRWLLLTNAFLESTTTVGIAAEARYVVDDVEGGMGGVENSVAGQPGAWQHFFVFDGDVAHTVRYELHDASGGTATISRLSVVAVPLSANDVVYRSLDAITPVVTAAASPVVDLAMGALDGEYVSMLVVNASEAPNQSNIYVRWRDGDGAIVMPEVHQPRQPWQSYLVVQRSTLAQPDAHYTLDARTDGAEAGVRNARAVAVRSEAFADVQFAADAMVRTSSATTLQPATSLTLADATARDYVVITSTRLKETCAGGPDGERHIEVSIDGAIEQNTHATDNCSYASTYGSLDALDHAPSLVSVGWSSLNGAELQYGGCQILALGLR